MGGGWVLEISTFLGPKWHSIRSMSIYRAQKSLNFQGPPLPLALIMDAAYIKSIMHGVCKSWVHKSNMQLRNFKGLERNLSAVWQVGITLGSICHSPPHPPALLADEYTCRKSQPTAHRSRVSAPSPSPSTAHSLTLYLSTYLSD